MYKQIPALVVLTVCCLFLVYGCKGGDSTDKENDSTDTASETSNIPDNADPYASVNDVSISKNEFDQFAKAKRAAQPETNFTDQVILDEMIATEILRQEAIKQGILDRADIIEQVKRQENNILINTLLTEKFSNLSFTDEVLKTEYDRLINLSDASEYKARHILLNAEEDANNIIEQLKGGADFIELAKQKSQDPSAANGGDLGWFKADSMVPPFAEAVRSMEKGSYTKSPVKTRFGWHVILLEDQRSVEQPVFKDVKQNVQRNLTRQTIEKYVDELEHNSTIVRPDNQEKNTESES